MATSSAALLIVLIALPFGGSCLAALFPANARNAEAYLAGGVALTALALVIATLLPGGQRRDRPIQGTLGSGARPRVQPEDGWLRLAARRTGHRHRLPGGAVRPLLHVPSRSRTALLLIPARLHGRDARHRAFGQPDSAGLLLGADQPLLLPADRLLAPDCAGAGRRPHGPDHYVGWRTLPVRRRTDARAYRRQLRPRPSACIRRRDPLALALRPGACPRSSRRLDEERPVSVPFLAAARDGSADASFGLPAFRHHGESRRLPAGAALAGAGRN